MKNLTQNPLALSGLVIIITVLFVAIFAPWLSPYDPNYIDIHSILLPPSYSHFMGTDGLGRDVFSRMLYGSRISLLVGFVAVGIATLIGTFLGAIAGFYRGYLDSIIMRFVDIMLSIPTFFLILAVIAFLTPSTEPEITICPGELKLAHCTIPALEASEQMFSNLSDPNPITAAKIGRAHV